MDAEAAAPPADAAPAAAAGAGASGGSERPAVDYAAVAAAAAAAAEAEAARLRAELKAELERVESERAALQAGESRVRRGPVAGGRAGGVWRAAFGPRAQGDARASAPWRLLVQHAGSVF
jgi:hypothetical protein